MSILSVFCLLATTASADQGCGIGEAAYYEAPAVYVEKAAPVHYSMPAPVTAPTEPLSGVSETGSDDIQVTVNSYADENSSRGFVYRLYSTALGREPDEQGLNFWVNKLDSGEMEAGDLVQRFLGSVEYVNKGKTNAEIVTDCYQVMLNREPDASGFEFWMDRLNVGMTYMSVCSRFVRSIEFTSLASRYGINAGTIELYNARDLNYERTAFVYRLYKNCLQRNPDTEGLEHWCKMLDNGMDGTNIARGFVFSNEYKNQLPGNETFVEMLYQTILGRASDSAGKEHWVYLLDYTNTREHLLNGFMNSNEFAQKCAVANINVGKKIDEPDETREWKANILTLSLVNWERAQVGLTPLTTREDLWERVAMVRAQEIVTKFSHVRPDGTLCWTAYEEAGFADAYMAENIAFGYRTEQDVMNAWMASPGHKANILNTNITTLATGLYKDSNWSQNFYAESHKK